MFKYILVFILYTNISLTALAVTSSTRQVAVPSKDDVEQLCSAHYTTLITDVIGALNMGMSTEDVKKNISAKASINKQIKALYALIDVLPTDKEADKFALYNALIDACVADNYNKPVRMLENNVPVSIIERMKEQKKLVEEGELETAKTRAQEHENYPSDKEAMKPVRKTEGGKYDAVDMTGIDEDAPPMKLKKRK